MGMAGQGLWTIGQLARETNLHAQTLRYYEHQDLLTPSARTAGGQRRYSAADRQRLHFIRHAREFGFPIDAIRELISLAHDDERSCADIDDIARRQQALVRRRIALLRELDAELERMIAACDGGQVADCRVLEVLGHHGYCHHNHGHDASDHEAGGAGGHAAYG